MQQQVNVARDDTKKRRRPRQDRALAPRAVKPRGSRLSQNARLTQTDGVVRSSQKSEVFVTWCQHPFLGHTGTPRTSGESFIVFPLLKVEKKGKTNGRVYVDSLGR